MEKLRPLHYAVLRAPVAPIQIPIIQRALIALIRHECLFHCLDRNQYLPSVLGLGVYFYSAHINVNAVDQMS
jgi:hypothetical protein